MRPGKWRRRRCSSTTRISACPLSLPALFHVPCCHPRRAHLRVPGLLCRCSEFMTHNDRWAPLSSTLWFIKAADGSTGRHISLVRRSDIQSAVALGHLSCPISGAVASLEVFPSVRKVACHDQGMPSSRHLRTPTDASGAAHRRSPRCCSWTGTNSTIASLFWYPPLLAACVRTPETLNSTPSLYRSVC